MTRGGTSWPGRPAMTRTAVTGDPACGATDGRGRRSPGSSGAGRNSWPCHGWRTICPPAARPEASRTPRGQICGRYGERIPADLAVIDMAADDTAVIAVANARRCYLPGHLSRSLVSMTSARHCIVFTLKRSLSR